ncbi:MULTISPECIES: polysaccharide biosynthesis C-terminal domain-containing protein [unclassified Spirosoma]|uniref:lipopolysaccharide biosynthesis protein n=1 Tax=unclassified Spirosoma TaxID=2621999 RepID=UPI00095DACCD|nr:MULTISPECIES: polysaccharide biosynthesis C-terminal domain-containing protein [unclassified Spirosoma]MBN8824050.1 polysaccharide biosynthesis C-terminal domain-containing protein [Spirosoma sp.]OJW70451.1 MAG: polysaccharide biosynthesis protein [Spirosoma sp. 48-14]
MSTVKKLASDTALYGVSTILGRLLYFALVPLHTYVFKKPGELSSNVELYSYVAVLLTLYTLGLETAFFRFAARAKDNQAERQRIFNDTLSIVIIVSTLASALIIGLTPQLVIWLDYPGQQSSVVWVALLIAIDAIVAIPFARLRVENKARQFVLAKLINIALVVFLNIFFLIICRDISAGKYARFLQPAIQLIYNPAIGPGYIFLANLLANASYFLLIRNTFKGFQFRINRSEINTILVYAFPLMLTNLAGLINNTTDRIFLRHFLPEGFYTDLSSADVLGIYGNCYKLSVFMALAINSFKFAADPFFFSKAEDKNAPDLLALTTKWFLIVCVLIWVGVSLNLDILGLLVSKRYRVGLGIVPILLLAYLFLGVYYNISFWFKLSDKTKFGTLITVMGAVITILGNILLIPVIGYMGCAVAFLVSSFVMMAICYLLGEKYYPVPYQVGSALGYILGAGLLIYLSWQFPIANLWVSVPVHVGLFGLFLAVIAVIERDTFRPVLARIRKQKPKTPQVPSEPEQIFPSEGQP